MAAHIVIAPDKFKGSLSAAEAARAIAQGLRRRNPTLTTVECPIADGGEGTLSAALAVGFQAVEVYAPGPTGDMIRTAYARRGDTAVVEMASVSGLGRLVGGVREPLRASSRGLGVVVSHALDDGCSHIVIGIGGSAGTDGGAGFLRGLGAELIDEAGNSVPEGGGGLASASALNLANLHPGLADAAVLIASDVDNSLCGPHGAAAIYGPQRARAQTKWLSLTPDCHIGQIWLRRRRAGTFEMRPAPAPPVAWGSPLSRYWRPRCAPALMSSWTWSSCTTTLQERLPSLLERVV